MKYFDEIDYLYGCNSRYTNGLKDFAKGFNPSAVKSAIKGVDTKGLAKDAKNLGSQAWSSVKSGATGALDKAKSVTSGARGAMSTEAKIAKNTFKANGGGLKGAAKTAQGYGNLAKHSVQMKGAKALNFAKANPGKVALGVAAVAAASAALIGAYKLHNIKRDGELYAYYTTSNGGTVIEERIASIPKSMNPDDLKSKVEETRAKLKAKGATKIKLRVVYDKSRLAQLKENMSNLFKKKSNSREVINSRCLDIYGGGIVSNSRMINSFPWKTIGVISAAAGAIAGGIGLYKHHQNQPVSKYGDVYVFYLDRSDMMFKYRKMDTITPEMTNGQADRIISKAEDQIEKLTYGKYNEFYTCDVISNPTDINKIALAEYDYIISQVISSYSSRAYDSGYSKGINY
jgi:hypothetical protein